MVCMCVCTCVYVYMCVYIYISYIFFIHSSIDGQHLGSFHILTVANNAAVNMGGAYIFPN